MEMYQNKYHEFDESSDSDDELRIIREYREKRDNHKRNQVFTNLCIDTK